MPIDLAQETKPIDPGDARYGPMLAHLQGNILKGHGRNFSMNIFLEFREEASLLRPRVAEIARRLVTSARQQHREAQQYRRYKIPGNLFGNFFLTPKGYRALGFSPEQLQQAFAVEEEDGVRSNFLEGMRVHGDELSDPASGTWDEGYRENRIDAMLLLADDDESFLKRQTREVLNFLERFADVIVIERGEALYNEEKEGIEHFGYADGRSQPIFLATDLKGEGNIDKWNPGEPLKLVLVPDRLALDPSPPAASASAASASADATGDAAQGAQAPLPDCFGSYFVFRKLEQDVLHFKMREQELADELGLQGEDRERAGAMVVGRFEDGTPIVLSQTNGFLPAKENNFTYDEDPQGLRCPFHAHIRKTNPRGDLRRRFGVPDEVERSRRIARRGITYGTREAHPNAFQALDQLPAGGVGLLFACFQANIARQFAFMQQKWAEDDDFVAPATGEDPVIGQKPQSQVPQKWPAAWGEAGTKPFSFGNFVTLKGGEFFFAPSIPFLLSLDTDGPA